MNNTLTNAERKYLARVKALPCSVCNAPAPSEAHHTRQSDQFTTVALCAVCHRDKQVGWHGERFAWRIRHLDEYAALNITLSRLAGIEPKTRKSRNTRPSKIIPRYA